MWRRAVLPRAETPHLLSFGYPAPEDPTNVDRLHHFFPTTLSAQHRFTAPHTTHNTAQNTSSWLLSVSTRSSLTSVGTWTLFSPRPPYRLLARQSAKAGCTSKAAAQRLCTMAWEQLANFMCAVILPPPVVRAPSATTWYVTLCEDTIPAAEAVSPTLPRWCASTNIHTDKIAVSLASNDHGSCT